MRRARNAAAVLLLWAVGGVSTAGGAEPRPLPAMMPEGTLAYVAWPGIDALAEASKGTSLADLVAEPEIARFREAWGTSVWPALDELIREQASLDGPDDQEAYQGLMKWLTALWHYPAAAGLMSVSMGEHGPQVDAGLVIRAGEKAADLGAGLGDLLASEGIDVGDAEEVQIGGATFREFQFLGPGMPVRWGAAGGDFLLTIGPDATAHMLGAGEGVKTLAESARFSKAMEVTGASAAAPFFYLDLAGVMEVLASFQPMFEGEGVPILGEEGGLKRLLETLGFGRLESLSAAVVPAGEGFKMTTFLHAPGLGEGASRLLVQKPLEDADLKVVPVDARWALVMNLDLAAAWGAVLESVRAIDADAHQEAAEAIAELEEQHLEFKIADDLLASFGDNWAVFDAPSSGGVWLLGTTIVAEVRPGNRLGDALEAIVKAVAEEADADPGTVTLRQDEHREQKITYVNVAGVPMPIAPAWVQYEGRWILGLYPQIVRATLDRMMDGGPSILDNADFQRSYKQMPARPSSIGYVDTAAGVEQLYPYALLVGQMVMAMGQDEGVPIDVSMVPTLPALTRHLFGTVSAMSTNDEGMLAVSYGALPVGFPILGSGGMELPVLAAILVPSLARARTQARSVVSMSNIRMICMSCLMYAADNKGALPPDLETLTRGEAGTYLQPEQLISPTDTTGAKGSYLYVAGQKNTMDPRNVVVYENPEITDGTWINVGFLDGHVERMRMEAFQERLAETNERIEQAEK